MINVNDRLIRDDLARMKPNAFAVLMAITVHIGHQSRIAFPGIPRLKALTGLGRDAVYAAIQRLVEMGYLERRQSPNEAGRFEKTTYRITTQYLQVFTGVGHVEMEDEAPPLPEKPYTVEPYTESQEQNLLTSKEDRGGEPPPPSPPVKIEGNQRSATPVPASRHNEKSKEERAKEFRESLAPYVEEYGEETIDEFHAYWSESGEGRKLRKEYERVFDIGRRLATWKRNQYRFGGGPNPPETVTDLPPDMDGEYRAQKKRALDSFPRLSGLRWFSGAEFLAVRNRTEDFISPLWEYSTTPAQLVREINESLRALNDSPYVRGNYSSVFDWLKQDVHKRVFNA